MLNYNLVFENYIKCENLKDGVNSYFFVVKILLYLIMEVMLLVLFNG